MKPSIKTKADNSAREKYWNQDYVAYWKARVDEANQGANKPSSVIKGDTNTSSDWLYVDAIGLLKVTASDNVLELGCGFGRSLPLLGRTALQVAAVDISEEMINVAKASCQEANIRFHVSPSEDLPFADNTFDVAICFAAFDAMYQTEALIEMNRVCKIGARLLVTGKNDNYHDDDVAALEAEVGARKKGHPNYFTDVGKLIRNLKSLGFGLQVEKYYSKRGDFARGMANEKRPERFYEYLFVLKKVDECSVTEALALSGKISQTFTRRGQST